MPQAFSDIQNHIISELKNARQLRYSELRPKEVPNDLFNYHLQFLVGKGFVSRMEDGYSLSGSGVQYVADPLTQSNPETHSLFKVNVITVVSRMVDGEIEILSQVRMSHPSYGKIGVPGGVVRKGETTEDAATRKLFDETGLSAAFQIVGMERRFLYREGALFSDVLFPIAYTDTSTGELRKETKYGINMWVGIDQAVRNESGSFDTIRGITKVLNAIRTGEIEMLPFFYQERTQRI